MWETLTHTIARNDVIAIFDRLADQNSSAPNEILRKQAKYFWRRFLSLQVDELQQKVEAPVPTARMIARC